MPPSETEESRSYEIRDKRARERQAYKVEPLLRINRVEEQGWRELEREPKRREREFRPMEREKEYQY